MGWALRGTGIPPLPGPVVPAGAGTSFPQKSNGGLRCHGDGPRPIGCGLPSYSSGGSVAAATGVGPAGGGGLGRGTTTTMTDGTDPHPGAGSGASSPSRGCQGVGKRTRWLPDVGWGGRDAGSPVGRWWWRWWGVVWSGGGGGPWRGRRERGGERRGGQGREEAPSGFFLSPQPR